MVKRILVRNVGDDRNLMKIKSYNLGLVQTCSRCGSQKCRRGEGLRRKDSEFLYFFSVKTGRVMCW